MHLTTKQGNNKTKMKSINFYLLLLLTGLPVFAFAQDEKISTEQPDQSYGAEVMEKKQLQIESSLYYNSIKQNPNPLISSNIIRYGLVKNVEVRLLVEQGNYRDVYLTETAHATYPLALGSKVTLLKEQKQVPGIAMVAYISLPFTNFDHQNSQWSPGLIAAIEKHFSALTITLNSGIKEEVFEHKWEYMNTSDFKYEVSEKAQVFAEYFGQYEAHESPVHNADAGFMYLLNSNCQVHLAGGCSIAHQPSYYFLTTGLAFRIK